MFLMAPRTTQTRTVLCDQQLLTISLVINRFLFVLKDIKIILLRIGYQ